MRRFLLIFLITGTCFSFSQSKGTLFIIGGGSRPDYMINKMIELAGGKNAKIVIIPNASGAPIETAVYQMKQFMDAGCNNVDFIISDEETIDADSNLAKLDNVSLIFFSGGDQNRLTRDLLSSKILIKINKIFNEGGVICGTSAGAAVMSEVMITGEELINDDSSRVFISIEKNNIETSKGFSFIKSAIIDQHFIKRKRNNRLISTVLENPKLLGIGIDESTAIIVHPANTFEVIGENQVVVYDASNSENISTGKNNILSASDIKMHILKQGEKFDLVKKKLMR